MKVGTLGLPWYSAMSDTYVSALLFCQTWVHSKFNSYGWRWWLQLQWPYCSQQGEKKEKKIGEKHVLILSTIPRSCACHFYNFVTWSCFVTKKAKKTWSLPPGSHVPLHKLRILYFRILDEQRVGHNTFPSTTGFLVFVRQTAAKNILMHLPSYTCMTVSLDKVL